MEHIIVSVGTMLLPRITIDICNYNTDGRNNGDNLMLTANPDQYLLLKIMCLVVMYLKIL